MERVGIALAGNILTDNVKMVEVYPEKGMLATITQESLAVGGAVPNTGIDIKKIDPEMQVSAFGRVGDDDKGKYVVGVMQSIGLNVDGVKVSKTAPTSYSDVITVCGTGERTFFHNRGANAEFCPDDVDLNKLDCKILHVGYLMLLDAFDKVDRNGETPMSAFLEKARSLGINTSVDMVSESSGNFHKVAVAALKHCDYVIIDEVEAGEIVGIPARDKSGKLDDDSVKTIMERLINMGVKEKVVVHCPEKGFCLNKNGKFVCVPSVKLPKGFIKGSVGAGDAFCAGALYGIYHGYDDGEMLIFANAVAVGCLSAPDSISGVRKKEDLISLINCL